MARSALTLGAISLLLAGEIDPQIVADPQLATSTLTDRRSQEAWKSLFDPNPIWVTREISVLATLHADMLPTLWAARLLYRGDAWTRRGNESGSLPRWRASDRDVKIAILRDLRWRRDPAFIPVLGSFLTSNNADVTLANSALSDLWLVAPAEGRAAAVRISDPRRGDLLPVAGQPSARMYALRLLLDTDGPGTPFARGGLEWALLGPNAIPAERIAALSLLPVGAVPDLIGECLYMLVEQHKAGSTNDESTTAVILCCSRLGEILDERTAQSLAHFAATAQRELACAAAGALARVVTWKNTIDMRPLVARLREERDPTVRHALMSVMLRKAPEMLATLPEAYAWIRLAKHRKALNDWADRQYLK